MKKENVFIVFRRYKNKDGSNILVEDMKFEHLDTIDSIHKTRVLAQKRVDEINKFQHSYDLKIVKYTNKNSYYKVSTATRYMDSYLFEKEIIYRS